MIELSRAQQDALLDNYGLEAQLAHLHNILNTTPKNTEAYKEAVVASQAIREEMRRKNSIRWTGTEATKQREAEKLLCSTIRTQLAFCVQLDELEISPTDNVVHLHFIISTVCHFWLLSKLERFQLGKILQKMPPLGYSEFYPRIMKAIDMGTKLGTLPPELSPEENDRLFLLAKSILLRELANDPNREFIELISEMFPSIGTTILDYIFPHQARELVARTL